MNSKSYHAVAAVLLLACASAWADPVSFKVKSGMLVNDKDETIQVDSGLYLNDDAVAQVKSTVAALAGQNADLIAKLEDANQKIMSSPALLPGLPTWATIAISATLSVLTAVASFFAIKEATAHGN